MKDIYRVTAVMEIDLHIDIEADNAQEAFEIARDIDGGDFLREENGGDWRLCDVFKIDCLTF